jgi:uncharacterized Tic20 family protein
MDETAPPLPSAPVLPPVPASGDDKIWAIFCHLSLLLGVGILLPLIVWLVKCDDSPLVAAHARAALNFHLSLIIYSFAAVISSFLLCFFVGVPVLLVMGLGSIILAIVAAVEASKGGFFHYPITIPFFK